MDETALDLLADQNSIMIADPTIEDSFRKDLNWYYEEAVAAIESGVLLDDSFDPLGPIVDVTDVLGNPLADTTKCKTEDDTTGTATNTATTITATATATTDKDTRNTLPIILNIGGEENVEDELNNVDDNISIGLGIGIGLGIDVGSDENNGDVADFFF